MEEDDGKWREYDGTAFESALQVDPEHGVSPVKLIDMRFIIALGELGGTMVRRRDLPRRLSTSTRSRDFKAPAPCPSSRSRTRGSSRSIPTRRRSTCSYSRRS